MDKTLTSRLLEKKLINTNTEVTARYRGVSVSGDPSVRSQEVFTVETVLGEQSDDICFAVVSTRDGSRRTITHKQIIEIDGMHPSRFAAVYNIKADGAAANVGKRRGRKPKDRSAQA